MLEGLNTFLKLLTTVTQFPTHCHPHPQNAAAISTAVLSAYQDMFPLASIEYMLFKFQTYLFDNV